MTDGPWLERLGLKTNKLYRGEQGAVGCFLDMSSWFTPVCLEPRWHQLLRRG